jgi:hypothetical protein
MPIDEQRIQKLEAELNTLKNELKLCNDARAEVLKKVQGTSTGTGGGQFRGWVPGCSALEQQVASVERELDSARKGEPPSPNFNFPSSHPEPPPFLSPDSQELYKKILSRTTFTGQLGTWLTSTLTDTPASTIVKAEINQEVTQFLEHKGPHLYGVETDYWKRVQEASK